MIDVGLRSTPASHDSARLGRKKPAARNAVVRLKTLAVPRPVIKPLVELTNPPPSDFCSSTTPIKARTIMRWMTIRTIIDDFRLRSVAGQPKPAATCRPGLYRQPRRSLHDPARLFYG